MHLLKLKQKNFYDHVVWILLDEPDQMLRHANEEDLPQILKDYNILMAQFKKASRIYMLAVGILF